jgi:alcohol-forming fatty acyl-CoA reductase
MGDTIAKELPGWSSSPGHKIPVLDIEAEIKLAFYSTRHRPDDSPSFAQEMKDLGLER